MAKTVPGRRVVVAADDMVDPLGRRLAEDQRLPLPVEAEDLVEPQTTLPSEVKELTYEQRLERQILMLNNGMDKYERVLNAGGELDHDDEKRMVVLVDSARKLELALAQIRTKSEGMGVADDLDICLGLIHNGMTREKAVGMFTHNPDLPAQLEEALANAE